MSKSILITESYLSDVCDIVGGALDDCAQNVMDKDLGGLVCLTTQNYKTILLRLLFEKEGEE